MIRQMWQDLSQLVPFGVVQIDFVSLPIDGQKEHEYVQSTEIVDRSVSAALSCPAPRLAEFPRSTSSFDNISS